MGIIIRRKVAKKPAVSLTDSAPVPYPAPEKFLSIRSAAAYAGVSDSSLRRWIKAERLRSYRAGRQLRIDLSDLIRFMQEQSLLIPHTITRKE